MKTPPGMTSTATLTTTTNNEICENASFTEILELDVTVIQSRVCHFAKTGKISP